MSSRASAGAASCSARFSAATCAGSTTLRLNRIAAPTWPARMRATSDGGASTPSKPTQRSCPICRSISRALTGASLASRRRVAVQAALRRTGRDRDRLDVELDELADRAEVAAEVDELDLELRDEIERLHDVERRRARQGRR